MRLADALTCYWLNKRPQLSPHTIVDYQLTFDRLIEFLGDDMPIEKIAADDLRRFLAHVKTAHNLGSKSIVNVWIALSSLWTWAEKELKIPQVVKHVEKPDYRRSPVEPFTQDEVGAMLAASCENPAHLMAWRDYAVLLILLDTGMRSSELCKLKIGDFDSRGDLLRIPDRKGSEDRHFHVTPMTAIVIREYLTRRVPPVKQQDALFATQRGARMDTATLSALIESCAERAGVEDANPRRFRDTFAINYLNNGGSPRELQVLLGSESMTTMGTYVQMANVDTHKIHRSAGPLENWYMKG